MQNTTILIFGQDLERHKVTEIHIVIPTGEMRNIAQWRNPDSSQNDSVIERYGTNE